MKTAEILGEPPQDYDPIAAEATYPYQDLLGYEIVQWERDFCRVEMPLETRHQNRQGLPHGGVHATLLDTAMGFAGSWCPYPGRARKVMTLSLTVNYIGRPAGKTLIAEGRVTGGGRKSYFAEARLTDDTGALIATATASMRYRGNSGSIEGDPV